MTHRRICEWMHGLVKKRGLLMTPSILILLPHQFYAFLKLHYLEECLVLKYRWKNTCETNITLFWWEWGWSKLQQFLFFNYSYSKIFFWLRNKNQSTLSRAMLNLSHTLLSFRNLKFITYALLTQNVLCS